MGPWALVGRALLSRALIGRALMGPLGPLWAGPLCVIYHICYMHKEKYIEYILLTSVEANNAPAGRPRRRTRLPLLSLVIRDGALDFVLFGGNILCMFEAQQW